MYPASRSPLTSSVGLTGVLSRLKDRAIGEDSTRGPVGQGGGIYHRWDGLTEITNSTITENEANFLGGGVAIDEFGSSSGVVSIAIIDSTISNNTASSGGGISSSRNGTESITIENTTIEVTCGHPIVLS